MISAIPASSCFMSILWFAFALVLVLPTPSLASSSASLDGKRNLVIGVDGGTESIRACCFDAVSGAVVGKSCAAAYRTYHPKPGWAEQHPSDWWTCMGHAVREAVSSVASDGDIDFSIRGICVDTTCCSVVALDKNNDPLRPCLLWMDARSAPQTKEIMDKCKGNPALKVNSGGNGPISAEWMTPKALWILQNEPAIWEKAKTICEYQDYINHKLTGEMCASSCNAASRWHWDGESCIKEGTEEDPYPGRPHDMYEMLGMPDLASKLPRRCLSMGSLVGHLTSGAAAHLGLTQGLPVAQGGADAFVGMIGLGCVNPGQLCLITGSSHLHCVVSSFPHNSPGIWGAYRGAPLPGINFAEGGQSSTGSIIRWARGILGANDLDYSALDAEAADILPGCDGLVALETFQGSRTPVTDPLARGALLGLSLSHTRAHIWRALLESVCFGTRACVEGLAQAGHYCGEIIIAGGATRSKLWLQMHADVTGKPVVVCENSDAPLLGCAILASFNVGTHASVKDAVTAMVRRQRRVEPSIEASAFYSDLYNRIYKQLGLAVRPVSHAIASFPRGGDQGWRTTPMVSPSLLACDFSNMKAAIDKCVDAGARRLHVDIFDGVGIDSPLAFTFGPQMVKALRKTSAEVILDVHMCVDRPARYVTPMKDAGANLFIFQWEAVADGNEALELATSIVDAGMECGLSINPSTGLVTVVDVLAVAPGFGGQKFQPKTSAKIKLLSKLKDGGMVPSFEIMVDGGINIETAAEVAGADVLVAGTFLFDHPRSLAQGVLDLAATAAKAAAAATTPKT